MFWFWVFIIVVIVIMVRQNNRRAKIRREQEAAQARMNTANASRGEASPAQRTAHSGQAGSVSMSQKDADAYGQSQTAARAQYQQEIRRRVSSKSPVSDPYAGLTHGSEILRRANANVKETDRDVLKEGEAAGGSAVHGSGNAVYGGSGMAHGSGMSASGRKPGSQRNATALNRQPQGMDSSVLKGNQLATHPADDAATGRGMGDGGLNAGMFAAEAVAYGTASLADIAEASGFGAYSEWDLWMPMGMFGVPDGEGEFMRDVEDLIVMGYPSKLPYERDFLAEGMALIDGYALDAV